MNKSTELLPTLGTFPKKQCVLHFEKNIQLILYILVIIFGVFGNASICYFFGLFSKSNRKSVSEILILYLSVTDFFASIFSPFIVIYWIVTCDQEWHFGTFGCKVLPFLARVFINVSVGIIVILALDRYRAICTPFKGQFKKKYIHISVFLATFMSILCEIFYLDALTWHIKPLKFGSRGCLVTPSDKKEYSKIASSILLTRDTFLLFIFTFTSIRIVMNLRKRNAYITSPNLSSRNNRHDMERVIRVIIVMQIVFIVLVLPRDLLHIIYQLSWLDGDGIRYINLTSLNNFLKVFQTANCCANVFIYAKMHDRFREKVIKVVKESIGCGTNNIEEPESSETVIISKSFEKQSYTRRLLRMSNNNIQSRFTTTYDVNPISIKWKSDLSVYDNQEPAYI